MGKTAFFIDVEEKSWRATRVREGEVVLHEPIPVETEDLPAATVALAQGLKELGYAGGGACVGLASSMVLAAPVDSQNVPRKSRRKGLLYRLEAQVPLEAERLTADYLPAVGGKILAVAVETARVQSAIDRLAQAGVQVASICPTALLALGEACRGNERPSDYVVVAGASGMDLFRLAGGLPVAWYTAASIGKLQECIEADLLERPVESGEILLRVLGDRPQGIDSLRQSEPSLRIECDRGDPAMTLAARGAARVLDGNPDAWPDLRRDGLAMPDAWKRLSRPLAMAGCAAILFLAATIASSLWRAARYDRLAAESEARQAAMYRRLYPNTPVPVGVAGRFRSEYKRLAGVIGESTDLPQQPGALDTLRRLIGNLPPAVRLRITDVRLSPTGVVVEGQTRSHSDAEAIVQSLSKGGLVFEPPRSETIARGNRSFVAFTLLGKPSAPEPATLPAGGGKRP